jgi:hypothetical protein
MYYYSDTHSTRISRLCAVLLRRCIYAMHRTTTTNGVQQSLTIVLGEQYVDVFIDVCVTRLCAVVQEPALKVGTLVLSWFREYFCAIVI